MGSSSSEEKSKSKIQDPSTVTVLGMRWEKELPDSSEGPKRLSAVESKELLRCEELLPLQALIAYRQQAVTETLLRAFERSLKVAESTDSTTGSGGGKTATGGAGGGLAGVGVSGGSEKDATAMESTAHDGMNSPQKKRNSVTSAFKKLFRNKAEKEKKKDEGGNLHKANEESLATRSVEEEGIGTLIGSGRDHSSNDRIDFQSYSKGNSSPFLKMRSMSSIFRSHKDLKLDTDSVPAAAASSSPSHSMSRVEAMDDVSLEYLTSELLDGVTSSISSKRADAEGESFFPLRLQLSASISVILSDVMPLVIVQVACGGDVTVKSMTDLRVDCYVQDVRIEDLVTITPVRRTLLSFANTTPAHASASAVTSSPSVSVAAAAADTDTGSYTPTPQIRVLYVSSGLISSYLRASCQPIEVAINVLCVERLSELVAARTARLLKVVATFGENDYLRKTAEWGAEGVITAQTGSNMAGQVAEAIVGDGMEICVEVRSNKVYLPHCSSRDEGCFVLDLGRAGLTGSYSVDNGLSLRLEVTDLCAGIIPPLPLPVPLPDSSAGAYTGIEYLLHPVDAHLTFFTPPLEKEKEKERERESILAFKSSSSSASASASALHRSSEYLEPDSALFCTGSRLESNLLIDLKLQSGLQIILTPPKLVQIVQYSRIFISFVWTVNNVFCMHLGEPTKGIAEEKLAEGLHYLNTVLNPTMKSSQSRNNIGSSNNNNSSSNSNSNSNSSSNGKGKKAVTDRAPTNLNADKNKSNIKSKGKGKVSAMFSKILQNISGSGTGIGSGLPVRAGKGALFTSGVRGGAGAEATRAGEY